MYVRTYGNLKVFPTAHFSPFACGKCSFSSLITDNGAAKKFFTLPQKTAKKLKLTLHLTLARISSACDFSLRFACFTFVPLQFLLFIAL